MLKQEVSPLLKNDEGFRTNPMSPIRKIVRQLFGVCQSAVSRCVAEASRTGGVMRSAAEGGRGGKPVGRLRRITSSRGMDRSTTYCKSALRTSASLEWLTHVATCAGARQSTLLARSCRPSAPAFLEGSYPKWYFPTDGGGELIVA